VGAAAKVLIHRATASRHALVERIRGSDETIPLPPPALRHRVHGSFDSTSFLSIGKRLADDVEAALAGVDRDLSSFERILDWGCGCGRVLRHISDDNRPDRLRGADIDPEAIAWCRGAFPGMAFDATGFEPPLPYSDASFDLIYGLSVFTHLDEELQARWLTELRRVSRPGGLVLLTTHGEVFSERLGPDDFERFRTTGFVHTVTFPGRFRVTGLPGFYQTSYQSRDYVMTHWAKEFSVEQYIVGGLKGRQDVVLLKALDAVAV
jgi:SAM-dependent methyltransferase